MAVGKKSAGPSKQQPITAFFGGGKSDSKPGPKPGPSSDHDDSEASEEPVDGDAVVDDDENGLEDGMEVDEETPAKDKGKRRRNDYTPPDESNLAPISDIPAIFADIVRRMPEIVDVARRIQGRKLRVATMCSGTESPLLALGLIRRAIQAQHGIDLEIEHVFSCEIVPFKQAYIERNFQPPLLFRDVCELGDEYAYANCSLFQYIVFKYVLQIYCIRI